MTPSRNSRRRAAVLVLIGACVVFALVWRFGPASLLGSSDPGLLEALAKRGRVAVVRGEFLRGSSPSGTELVDVGSLAGVSRALAGEDPRALARALEAASVTAVMVDPREAGGGLTGRFARYEHVEAFRGLYLSRSAALYAPEPATELSAAHRQAMATVARGLLEGQRPPRITSFPEPLRRVSHVEVMVLLEQGARPRLWRSARGSSLGRALVTAATVARERWQEREAAMGAPLDEILPRLTVEVALLLDDGTLGDRDAAFVDRVVTKDHGVAYERKGAWRYFLPAATADEGHGRASVAYTALFEDNGLSSDSLDKSDLRPYRLAVETLAESPPERGPAPSAAGDDALPAAPSHRARDAGTEPEPHDGLSEVAHPDEVLR